MANTISTAFIKQFESEVHIAYQRMGSKLRNTVRTVSNVSGNVVRFQKICQDVRSCFEDGVNTQGQLPGAP